jgi:hypothetical protein
MYSPYTERRLEELRNMPVDKVAQCKIRDTTPAPVKAVILAARKKFEVSEASVKTSKQKKTNVLQDGDVLLMRNRGTLWDRTVSTATKSPYVHAALYSKGKVYDVVAPFKKNRVKTVNQVNTVDEFAKRDKGLMYDIFRPKDKKIAQKAAQNVEAKIQKIKGYSRSNAFQSGMRDRFGFGISTNFSKNYQICSELVYDCFDGLIGNDASSSVSPGRLGKNKHLEKVQSLKLSLDTLNDFFKAME